MDNKSVFWNLELNIKPGKLDTLKLLAADMTAATLSGEPNTLHYIWSIDEDATQCHIFEAYTDSDAVRIHLSNFQGFAERFFDCIDISSFNVYGNPDEELVAAMSTLGCKFYRKFDGFSR